VLRAVLFAGMPLVLLAATKVRWKLLAVLSAVITASFTWTGHGAAGDGGLGVVHQAADVLHLLAAAVWIGALVDFCGQVMHSLRVSQAAPAHALLAGLLRFSAVGPALVATLVLTGLINSWVLIDPSHWAALFTTPYGLALLVKLGLFLGMLVLAAVNRLRLTPQLHAALDTGTAADAALRPLRRSLLLETALGLLVLAVVAWLGTMVPPADG
jgi:putative copper resistance protein D